MEITDIDLAEKLDKVISVTEEECLTRRDFQLDGIKEWANNPRSSDRRSSARIEKVTLDSSVCEVGIAQGLGGFCNTCDFDYKRPLTYAWDVGLAGYQEDAHFEIKWMSLDSDWYSFNEKLIEQVENRKQYYDRLIVATNIRTESGWDVYPRFIINPQKFTHYVKRSKYDNYKPYYYNHHNPSCVILNEESILQLKELAV